MDGGTEWDAARNWLEMADREDLLELLSYLGVDMGSLPQDQLVKELYWTKSGTRFYKGFSKTNDRSPSSVRTSFSEISLHPDHPKMG